MSDIRIDRGIPIPMRQNARYPFREMRVGDSILLTGNSAGLTGQWARSTGWKFTTRKVEGGVRVWRTK